jgi:hypothetical protein
MTSQQRNWPSATANGIPLTDPIAVTFNSDVVVIARERGKPTQKLYYNVRHNDPSATDGNLEYSGWYELDMTSVPATDPSTPPTPVGVRELGAGLVTLPASALSILPTAHAFQAADLPFAALSDDRYIYIFRPSINGTFYLDRFMLIQVQTPKDDTSQARRDAGASRPARYQLQRIWESRFRVSRKKDTPADETDVVGYSDMLGDPFIEPTQELSSLPRSRDGRFAVALLPTSQVDQRRWYFFVAVANSVQVTSWPQSPDGLIDFMAPASSGNVPNPPSSFEFSPLYQDGQPLTIEAGIAVRVYAEQDPEKDGTKMRRAMRLMVTVPVSAATLGLPRALAVFDFGILPAGLLAAPQSPLRSPLLDGTLANKTFTRTNPLPARFALPATVVHVASNSTIYAYLLGAVQPAATPCIIDGGDGLVHCYYAGLDTNLLHPFLVAQYDPEVQRPSVSLAWTADTQRGMLTLTAQRPGTTLNQLAVTVADTKSAAASANLDLCDMTVDYGSDASGIGTEQWTGLPRDLVALTDVLNGNASGELAARGVQEGSVRYFDYSGKRHQARLPLGGAVPAWLTLVSTRLDLPLADVTVAAGHADTVTLLLRFSQGGNSVTQTWADVPAATDDLRNVLRGDAASFSYKPSDSDPWVLALSAAGGTSTMLFHASSSASAAKTSIAISAGSARETVNVRLVSGSVDAAKPAWSVDQTWPDLPADSALLATALLEKAEVRTVFPVISASDNTSVPYVSIKVDLQQVSKPVDLRTLSLLFGTLPPDVSAPVVATAAPVVAEIKQGHSQAPPLSGKQLVNRLVALSAVPAQSPNNGVTAAVVNQVVKATPAAGNGAWVSAKPLWALNLTGDAAMTVPTDLPGKDALAPGKAFTLETWLRPDLRPEGHGKGRVLSFNGANAANTATGEVVPSSFLEVFAQPSLQFGLLKSASATPSYGLVHPDAVFAPDRAFTWELWVKAAAVASPQGQDGALFQVLDLNNPTAFALQLSLDHTLTPVVTVNDGKNSLRNAASAPLQANVWTHLAVTGECTDPQNKQWLVSLYTNGDETSIKDKPLKIDWGRTGPGALLIGGNGGAVNASAAAALAELRYWQLRRARIDIQESLYFTLAGSEPGLVGYWRLDDKPADKSTDPWPILNAGGAGRDLNGTIQPSLSQTITSSADGAFLAMASGIGGAPAQKVNAFLRSTHWNHVAVSYRAGSAVRLDSATRSFVNGGHDKSLNVTDAFSVEAWIQVDASSQPVPQTLVGKWGKAENQQSYWLGVNATGQLNLKVQFQYTVGQTKTLQLIDAVANAHSLRDGLPHHVAATIRTDTKTDPKGNTPAAVEVTVMLYVDGASVALVAPNPTKIPSPASTAAVYAANVQSTTADLTLGAAALSPSGIAADTAREAQMYLTGMLTGVVIWSRALDAKDVARSIQERSAMERDGAIAAWWFREQAGVDAVDSVGGLVAKLTSNELWAVFNRLSELLFYANGRQLLAAQNLTTEDAAMSTGYPGGPEQFVLGAYKNGAALADSIQAQFSELRLWQQVRSARQIADMRFARLAGTEAGLAGYWNFDGESLADRSPLGNNGIMWNHAAPPFVPSAAPAANEGPAVLNIYGGQATEFNLLIDGTPAVIEFSEVTREPVSALEPDPKDGQPPKLLGTLERAYYYTTSTVNLTPGFYAGALRLVYFGQVQTDATLLGYIEGAPPVPSENLTRAYYESATGYFSYFNNSSVTFTNTETTTLVFNSSYSVGGTLDHTTSAGFALKAKLGQVNGIAAAVSLGVTDNGYQAGIKEKGGFTTQDVSIENASSSWALAMTDSLALRGNWENPATIVNPEVGRRFLPDNVGYALVSSLTADVYLTFNAATGAAVGRSIVPNPYIPPDNNIITFRIDPHYVKNGTLDGKVGLYTDTDYTGEGKVPGSYFKPIEAYRLKRQIAKSAVDDEKYYAQFSSLKRALGSTTSLGDQEPYRLVDRSPKTAMSRKGIANTYVWTAAGGMHTEQEQFTDQFTTTFTGGYTVSNQFGPAIDFKGGVGSGAMFGGFFTLEWLGGFKIEIIATKTRTKANAFGLTVAVTGEPALLGGWDIGRRTYGEKPVPGKVASYRFNTFYLPPDTENGSTLMNDVVDRMWLRGNEPDAVTLRTANTGNPAWRILHRVTYVNRIPPGAENMPNQMLHPAVMRIVDLDNNEVLMDLILNALGDDEPTPVNVGTAVASVVNPPGKGGGQYPQSQLSALIPWWDDFRATTRDTGDQAKVNYALLQELQLDILTYVLAGWADDTFPLKPSK